MLKTQLRIRDAIRGRIPDQWKSRVDEWIGSSLLLRRVIRRVLENRRDLRIIERELSLLSGGPWHTFQAGFSTTGATERVVEIPWVLSRYQGERRVLDVGTTFGLPLYTRYLLRLGIPELHGVDIARMRIRGMRMTQADVRKMPYADSSFELINCISTLEHIGRVHVDFGVRAPLERDGDLRALAEMRRVLCEDGRILVSVPFGQLEYQPWFKQYDLDAWQGLLVQANLRATELAFYSYSALGWHPATDPLDIASRTYRDMGAPAATGLLCASLTRP